MYERKNRRKMNGEPVAFKVDLNALNMFLDFNVPY